MVAGDRFVVAAQVVGGEAEPDQQPRLGQLVADQPRAGQREFVPCGPVGPVPAGLVEAPQVARDLPGVAVESVFCCGPDHRHEVASLGVQPGERVLPVSELMRDGAGCGGVCAVETFGA